MTKKKENAEKAIYYYEKCIELFDEVQIFEYTKEDLYFSIATLYALDEMKMYDEAINILEQYNGSGKYNNLIASYLFSTGKREEAKNRVLQHCIGQQIFVFNDLSILADMYIKEECYETAILFLEVQIKSFELFMSENGNYANRAYAGKAHIISELYAKIGKSDKAAEWHDKAKKHAAIYKLNPSMLVASMKYCNGLNGRMIDSYGEILDQLDK